MAEQFSPTLTTSFPFSLRLLVHSSFKNLAYLGTCLIASNKGMLTWTFLNVSSISSSCSSLFSLARRVGNGGGIWVTRGSLNDTLGAFFGLGSVVSWWKGGRIGSAWGMGSSMGSSKVLPLLSVIALAFDISLNALLLFLYI